MENRIEHAMNLEPLNNRVVTSRAWSILKRSIFPLLVSLASLLVGMTLLRVFSWDLSIPWNYPVLPGDQVWQLTLSKTLLDNGWILQNQYLGAPEIAQWYGNPAAQTSSLHSVLMLFLSLFIDDAVRVQQVYYLLNFPMIALTSFIACRLLGISRIGAAAAAILFPFIAYRFNFSIYAYLANYFAVPLALVPVYWVLKGDYAAETEDKERLLSAIRRLLCSTKFWLGVLFIALIALSDGYYAFFTLLLLGFAAGVRAVCGDIRHPRRLLAPVALIVVLMLMVLVMTWPLTQYKRVHPGEFYQNGNEDPVLVKHSFEAEVYSSSLKMLLAPSPGTHRLPVAAELGQEMLDTSNDARLFPTSIFAPLGMLCSLLFIVALALTAIPATLRKTELLGPSRTAGNENDLLWASVSLGLFIFLCTISGGIGSLIAMIYPPIRAYDRFAIFLIFVLYVGAGAALTSVLAGVGAFKRAVWTCLVLAVCALSLFDQIPRDVIGGSKESRERYLAERKFIRKVEAALPEGAMVYNYPYSQYLLDSKYYGWGGFGHIRLYLHSKKLRWSNGASKNSPVDDWHARLARLPASQLIAELRAAGFRAMVVDRRVVKDDEYKRLNSAFMEETGRFPIVDETSKLAFVRLDDPGYRLAYDRSYTRPERLTVFDKDRTTANRLPRLINGEAFDQVLAAHHGGKELVLDRARYPAVFINPTVVERGLGDYAILPVSDLKGAMRCSLASGAGSASIDDTVVLQLSNNSDFDWQLNGGKYPLRIGANLYSPDGTLFSWDKGIRVQTDQRINKGTTAEIRFPIGLIDVKLRASERVNYVVNFAMVQDGRTWFNNIGCSVSLER